MANEMWKFVQAKSKQTMKQVFGIRDEKTRIKVTPPLAVAPLAQEDGIQLYDMRWNDDGIAFNPQERFAPDHNGKHARTTSHKNQVNSLYIVVSDDMDLLCANLLGGGLPAAYCRNGS